MERKKILDEGLLEKYLLGELNETERNTIEKKLQDDDELKKHFEQLEADFEQMAFENAIDPDDSVRKNLIKKIEPIQNKRVYGYPFMAAAGLALLFLLTTFWMFNKWKSAEQNIDTIQIQTSSLEQRLEALEKNYQVTSNRMGLINNHNTTPFILTGNEKISNSRVIAYVNHKDRLVIVNPTALPELPSDKTYQMWSDVDGEMISMGLLHPNEEWVPVKYIDKAESLNITIEPAGGNDHATVENLVSQVII